MAVEKAESLPCIICDKVLYSVFNESPYQPDFGVGCITEGNYGSEVFDPEEAGKGLAFNICDECLLEAKKKKVIKERYAYRPKDIVQYNDWE